MATVGINFGSATSGAGFNVTTTVSSILAIESSVETPWKANLTHLQAQDTALSQLGTSLSSLSSALGALTSFDGVLAAKQGSSSDSNLLALTGASPQAVAGSHTITITSLAQTASEYTDRITNAKDTLSGSVTLQVGSGASQTLTLNSSDTLASVAQTINSGKYGVTASVITDTQGSRLSLVSNTSGAAGALTLTSNLTDSTTSTSVAFHVGQTGADAQLTVDGLQTTSASNTVTSAIPGVTFQLLAASTTPLQVQITNDNNAIETAVQSLVTAYNGTISAVAAQEGKDASGNAEPLFGDPTLALLQNQLASDLFAGTPSGALKSITQLGLSVGNDGKLSLDLNALQSTLNTHFGDLTGFFQNVGSFGQGLTSSLDQLGSVSNNGAISLALQQNASQESGINTNIATEDTRLAAEKTRLTSELNQANQILQSIPQQLNQVNEIYSAITGYAGNTTN